MTINQLLASYNANIISFAADYDYFNEYYSLNVLANLSNRELAERLFGGRNNKVKGACPGLFSWLEWGYNKQYPATIQKPFGIGKFSFQVGILQQRNEYWQYIIATQGHDKISLNSSQAENYAVLIRNVLQDTCNIIEKHINKNNLIKPTDYELLFDEIKDYLVGRGDNLYWNDETGEPMAFLIKYYHCVFNDKFACWYTNTKLKQVYKALNIMPTYKESFMMNAQLALYAKQYGIDNANFERLVY
jgi:hypothetical protein